VIASERSELEQQISQRRGLLVRAAAVHRAIRSNTVSTRGSDVAGKWSAWRYARSIAAARRRIVETALGQRGRYQA
jgi:hypothetical protein